MSVTSLSQNCVLLFLSILSFFGLGKWCFRCVQLSTLERMNGVELAGGLQAGAWLCSFVFVVRCGFSDAD